MSSDSASILDSVKAQLQQDLNRLIENHNQEMKSEVERMKIEREALTAQFQSELNDLRLKHKEEILKAEESQKKKLESIREVLKLEVNALSNINNDEQIANTDEAEVNNDNDAKVNIDDNDESLDSNDPIDHEILKKFEELDKIDEKMSELPQNSRDPQDYQNLLLINKQQYRILRDLASYMKEKVIKNTEQLNSQLININKTYHDQFSQYEWFHNKQKTIQDMGKLEQKSHV